MSEHVLEAIQQFFGLFRAVYDSAVPPPMRAHNLSAWQWALRGTGVVVPRAELTPALLASPAALAAALPVPVSLTLSLSNK